MDKTQHSLYLLQITIVENDPELSVPPMLLAWGKCQHLQSCSSTKRADPSNAATLSQGSLAPWVCFSHCSQNICVSSFYSHVPCCQCSSRVKSRFDSDFASFRLHGVQKSEPPQVSLKPKASWLRSGFLNACNQNC